MASDWTLTLRGPEELQSYQVEATLRHKDGTVHRQHFDFFFTTMDPSGMGGKDPIQKWARSIAGDDFRR